MLKEVLRYCVGALALWASVQSALLAYQAEQYLVAPYNAAAAIGLLVTTVALLAAAILAALGRRPYQILVVVASTLTPLFVVIGLSRMGRLPLREAFRQVACSPGVDLCYNRAATLLHLLPWLALAAIASHVVSRRVKAPSGA
jgi:hypothetical protein